MKRLLPLLICSTVSAVGLAAAETTRPISERQILRTLQLAFPGASKGWHDRLVPDDTMALCAKWHNQPPKDVADAIKTAERKTIRYPEDGKFLGDWRRGETIAQSGYGLRFTDTEKSKDNGGNCYACHQLAPTEVSFGTVGTSLRGYRRVHAGGETDARLVYEKIFNSQAVVACSLMPRFGSNGILSIGQIKDLVALLLDPESPVNSAIQGEPLGTGSPEIGRAKDGAPSLRPANGPEQSAPKQ